MLPLLFILLFIICVYVLINIETDPYMTEHNKRVFKDENGKIIPHATLETEEQHIASKYITKDDKVLELGARYGTVSAIILDKVSESKNCVIVDPDKNITQALVDNLNNCGYGDAQVFIGTIGANKKKIHSNDSYATYTETCEGDSCDIENLNYKDLQDKYSITFNTIVADCEGCLPEVIEHIITYYGRLEPINKIIFETDRPSHSDYKKVYRILEECGFKNIRNKFVQIWVR